MTLYFLGKNQVNPIALRSPKLCRVLGVLSAMGLNPSQLAKRILLFIPGSPDLSFSNQSFWSYGRPSLDYTHFLRKNQYQLASRSPQSVRSRSEDTDNMGEEVSNLVPPKLVIIEILNVAIEMLE